MKLEDLFERLKDELKMTWDRIQNSSLYIQSKERYEELSPNVQKALKYAGSFFVLYFVLSFPLSWLSQASENRTDYEENRELIESLLEVQNELKNSLDVNININPSELQSTIQQMLGNSNLTQDQIKSTSLANSQTRKLDFLPENVSYVGVLVNIEKMNLSQILDIGVKLKNLTKSTKLIEMDIQKNKENDHYFDVEFLIAGFTGAS